MGIDNTDESLRLFPGDSELSRMMRAQDWSATPLGPAQAWPEGLKVPLQMMLSSRFEMWLGWGPDLQFFYNDAYVPTLGIKHPWALGQPMREVWKEVYAEVAEQIESVRAGTPTWNKALLLLLERSGYPEETYHTFSYSPLRGDSGAVEGLMCVVSEETESVIGERRLNTLRALADALLGTSTRDAVLASFHAVLGDRRKDFPFSLLYLRDDAGQWHGHASSDDATALLAHDWPLQRMSGETSLLRLPLQADRCWPCGDWSLAPREALLVKVARSSGEQPFGALVLGLNPYRPGDSEVAGIAQLIAGQLSGALGNVNTLESERRRAERVWSNSRDLLLVLDADGVMQSVSPSWTRILGHPLEAVVGHRFTEFLHPDDVDNASRAHRQAVEQSDLTAFEDRYLSRAGEVRWLSWHTRCENQLVFAYGRDITEEKAQAAALAAAEDALRQAQKMEAVGQLTGGIAHDFNNLLTGIIGSLDMMQRRVAQGRTGDVDRYIAAATTSANRAASLIQRLLAFSRRQSLDPRPVDADKLVRGMEELLRRSIGESIRLEALRSAGLWRTRCDPHQLESAILNLAINARDAMPEGGRLTIESANASIDLDYAAKNRQATPGQYVCISVTDTGSGMTPDVISRAFEPFFTTKPIGQGTGLGLSMIYGFARQSEGFVNIDSEAGQGTTVRLYLPRHYVEGEEIDDGDSRQSARLDAGAGEVVLVVEDEPAVRALVIDVLEDLGYQPLEAMDGLAGLEIVRSSRKIDLLVTDVGLPGLNGRQLADAARVLRPGLKVLFVTGYAHNAAVGNGLLEPGMEIITKPFAIDKLAMRVKAMIEA
ncbi:PAS domain-containing protein [Hydrocarboniphaga sp.]|uniref:PAS domain-containing protein n=1 Tax=Hydrocarboniphaga sp. TaxID=2033016 RepID=UPI003D099CCF